MTQSSPDTDKQTLVQRIASIPAVVPIFAVLVGSILAAILLQTLSPDARGAPKGDWSDFIPAEVIGARSFVEKNPELDGRGVIVAVLDSGVDPMASGLTKTSDGKVKVIEARDFSGQGDVELERALVEAVDGRRQARVGDLSLVGLETLADAADQVFYLGTFSEEQIGPSRLQDLNHNGTIDDDLALLIYRTGSGPDDVKAILDIDNNGDLVKDPVVRPYHVGQELFVPPARQPAQDVPDLTMAFELDARREVASLHYTDGSHGTHVAGIIAGYKVFDKEGWDGVAPGARILSLKIGHNALAGGATTPRSFKRALRYAAEYSTLHQVPVVANASYGVGSVIEGQSDIDRFVDDLIQAHPLLSVTFSAGNRGPGLSSVGTPAAADLAFAVGAMLPRQVVPTLYGGKIDRDRIFAFSARGGELTKPEIIAPGVASISVPIWDGYEVKNGTSMASPQTAGAMALIWAGLGKDSGAHAGIVRRALMHSAKPLPGYGLHEQGHGVINVGRALELAKRLASNEREKAVLGFRVRVHAPNIDGTPTPGALWRTGMYRPGAKVETEVEVTPLLNKTLSAKERAELSMVVMLASDKSWVDIDKPRLLFRGERSETFHITYNSRSIDNPGVHTARLIGHHQNASRDVIAFESWHTVVVPEPVGAAQNYKKSWKNILVKPGEVWRRFVFVPPGTSFFEVEVHRPENAFASTYLTLFDASGYRQRPRHRKTTSDKGTNAFWRTHGEELVPGTWEITVSGDIRKKDTSRVDVNLRFSGALVEKVKKLKQNGSGHISLNTQITNTFPEPFVGRGTGRIFGQLRRHKEKTKGHKMTIPITLGPDTRHARVTLEVTKALYNETTDLAATVKNAAGDAIAQLVFGSEIASLSWGHASGEQTYQLEILPGFTHKKKEEWSVEVEQSHRFAKSVELKVTKPAKALLLGYPHVPMRLTLKAQDTLPSVANDFLYQGEITLQTASEGQTWAVIPIEAQID